MYISQKQAHGNIKLLLIVLLVIVAILFYADKSFASEDDEPIDILNGMTLDEFHDGWQHSSWGYDDNGEVDYAMRAQCLDDGTILYDVWGKGDCPGLQVMIGGENTYSVIVEDGFSGIAEEAFIDSPEMTDISLPESITKIGNSAFSGCSGISTIDIPKHVTKIGEEAFYNCKQLKGVKFSNGLQSIGEWAFAGCSNITSVETPSSTKRIGDAAFYDCPKIKKLILNGNNAVIGYDIVNNSPLIETFVVGDGIKKIGEIDNKFKNLKSLTVSTNTKYGDDNSFIEKDTTVAKVIYTGKGTLKEFNFPLHSKKVVIKNGVKAIGEYAFRDSKATTISIPSSVTRIGEFAFLDCKQLKKLTIGKGVKKIDYQVVDGCKKLTTIVLKTKKLTKKNVKKDCLIDSGVKTIIVKVGSKAANKKYIKKYKKIFTKKWVDRKVKVK